MKIFKTAGTVLAAVIIVPLLVAAIPPKEYTVKRSTVIERSAEEVFHPRNHWIHAMASQ